VTVPRVASRVAAIVPPPAGAAAVVAVAAAAPRAGVVRLSLHTPISTPATTTTTLVVPVPVFPRRGSAAARGVAVARRGAALLLPLLLLDLHVLHRAPRLSAQGMHTQ